MYNVYIVLIKSHVQHVFPEAREVVENRHIDFNLGTRLDVT